jgi:uncharacterized protein (TIGR02996 family)
VTTEDDFHRILDANPDDHHTRLVLADFLQDRGDPRAAGYRALGKLRLYPVLYQHRPNLPQLADWTHTGNVSRAEQSFPRHSLPRDWFDLMPQAEPRRSTPAMDQFWRYHTGRKTAEDAAALAFGQLPPERQSELLRDPEQMSRRMRAKRLSRA